MRVGFIGLGNMGGPMALNTLKEGGHSMVVHDLRPDAGAEVLAEGAAWADTPAAVARASEIVCTSLPGPPQVEAVALGPGGILEGMEPGKVYIDLSTNSPSLVRRLHAIFKERGVDMLDAPVSGGVTGARSRNLAVMVGGDPAVYERCRPVLEAIGTKVYYTGGIGCGQVAKLVHNCAHHIARLGIAECMILGVKAGVELEPLWEAVRRGSLGGMRSLHEGMPSSLFKGKFTPPSFALNLLLKDVGLATDLGREFRVPMPLANYSEQILIEAANRGWGEEDSHAVIKILEERAGVQLRLPGF